MLAILTIGWQSFALRDMPGIEFLIDTLEVTLTLVSMGEEAHGASSANMRMMGSTQICLVSSSLHPFASLWL